MSVTNVEKDFTAVISANTHAHSCIPERILTNASVNVHLQAEGPLQNSYWPSKVRFYILQIRY